MVTGRALPAPGNLKYALRMRSGYPDMVVGKTMMRQAALDTRTQLLNGWVDSAGSFWRQLVAETKDFIDDQALAKILRPPPTASTDGDPDLSADVANALD